MSTQNRLRELRVTNGITQQGLSEKMGVSQQSIAGWENGRTLPSIEMVAKFADLFGVSTDYLLCRTDEPYVVMRTEIKNGERIVFATKKPCDEEIAGFSGEGEEDKLERGFTARGQGLPDSRRELESLVERLVRKAIREQQS